MYFYYYWLSFVSAVSASNTDNIFSLQILFQAIQLRLCCLPSLILQVLGRGQSERNLEIGLSVFVRRPGSEALREGLAKN